MRSHRILLALTLTAAVAGLVACGSDGGSDASSPSSTTAGNGQEAGTIDVCSLVTAEDAARVFGAPAKAQPPPASEPLVAGVCIYVGADDADVVRNQLLQVRVYDGEQFYGDVIFPDSEDVDLGERGFVSADPDRHTVDVQFVQDGRTVAVSYSTGPGVDTASSSDEVVAVAREVSDGL